MAMASCRSRSVPAPAAWRCSSKPVASCSNACNGCIRNNRCNSPSISSRTAVSARGNVATCMKSGKPNERCGPRPAARQPRRTGSPATSRTLPSPLCRQRFASAPGHRPGRPRRRSRTEPGVGRPAPALSLPGPGAGPLARAEPAGGSLRQPAGGPATGLAGARRQRLSRPGLVRPEPGATTRCDGPAPEPGTRRPAPGALARRRSRDAAGTPAAAPLGATPGHTAAPVAAMARPAAGRRRAAHPGARRPVAAACRSSPRRSAAGGSRRTPLGALPTPLHATGTARHARHPLPRRRRGPARTRPTADPGQLRGRPPHPGPAYPLHPAARLAARSRQCPGRRSAHPRQPALPRYRRTGQAPGSARGARNPPVRTRRSMIQLPDELGLILGLALLALVPFIAVMATSFIKMTVVFSLLRNALGVQQIPPNMAMYGLAIILSLYVMAPVGFATRDYLRNHDVSLSDSASVERFLDEGMAPYRNFLKRQIQEREHTFFMESTRQVWPSEYAERLDPDSLLILLPAFTVSELTRAFEIGFLIYLPFIAIDLIISNILLAMGMMMVSPMTISLPFKLLLFVLLDGWARLTHGLVISYGG
ncbi:putative secreted protein [Pseudomonas aeruginosa MH38]|nr:putative secreted protein [Pseudomonas aeruginosa MH38]